MSRRGGSPAGSSSGNKSLNSLMTVVNAGGMTTVCAGVASIATNAYSGQDSRSSSSNWDFDMMRRFCCVAFCCFVPRGTLSASGDGRRVILRP